MSLKELTADKHTLAEATPFMKAVFDKTMTMPTWADWSYQRSLFYKVIETRCAEAGYLEDLPGIERAELLMQDYNDMRTALNISHPIQIRRATLQYYTYLMSIPPADVLAHLYVWHMGDMFGGQMIKKIVDAPHASLEFENAPMLMKNLRAKLSDELGPEANVAFEWAIRIMGSYDV